MFVLDPKGKTMGTVTLSSSFRPSDIYCKKDSEGPTELMTLGRKDAGE